MQKSQEKPKVLMIEDDPDFRTIVKDWLSSYYDVTSRADGEGLLEEIEAVAPDFIILDVMLPGPSGFKLCNKIRTDPRFSDLPVLFLTGCKDDEDFLRSLRAGGTAYMIKPLSRKQLLAKLQEISAQPYNI